LVPRDRVRGNERKDFSVEQMLNVQTPPLCDRDRVKVGPYLVSFLTLFFARILLLVCVLTIGCSKYYSEPELLVRFEGGKAVWNTTARRVDVLLNLSFRSSAPGRESFYPWEQRAYSIKWISTNIMIAPCMNMPGSRYRAKDEVIVGEVLPRTVQVNLNDSYFITLSDGRHTKGEMLQFELQYIFKGKHSDVITCSMPIE
jgi:hypothetical protein